MEPGAGGRPVCTELVRDQKIQTHPERGLATNIIIYVCTHQLAQLYLLSTSQTGDGYLCIVCVWFTFSCTLVPNSFVIIASLICMVHIVSLSASIKPENINIGFIPILNEFQCLYHYSWPGASSAVGSPVTDLIWTQSTWHDCSPTFSSPGPGQQPGKNQNWR